MRAFYHPDQARHSPLQSLRLGRVIAAKDLPLRTERLLSALTNQGITPGQPPEQGLGPVLRVHTAPYLHFLETIWERWQQLPEHGPEVWPSYFPYWSGRPEDSARRLCPTESVAGQAGWYLGDMSAPLGPLTWLSAMRSCDTAVASADALLAHGGIVYALCRPSGHHARADRAAGLCFVNNTAVAAEHLRQRWDRVAILDVDVHHGDGTQQVFYGRSDILTVSIHADPLRAYPYFTGYAEETGHGVGDGFNLNLPLPVGSTGEAMAAAVECALERIRAFAPDALVLALGFDAHKDDPVGLMKLEAADFAAIGRQLRALGLPILVVQEGGYAIDAISQCLGVFIAAIDQR
jgi:acetoin utilization deacetylase AcuC-like enzyme